MDGILHESVMMEYRQFELRGWVAG